MAHRGAISSKIEAYDRQSNKQFRWLWRSELGKAYEKDTIEYCDDDVKRELRGLRQLPENRKCADCSVVSGACWASVKLGVFLCIRCASHHRSVGMRSISKPKDCTMDLWAPDELERMKQVGNKRAKQMYGGSLPNKRPSMDASDEEWRDFLVEKYGETRRFAPNNITNSNTVQATRSCADALSRAVCIELTDFHEIPQLPPRKHDMGGKVIPPKDFATSRVDVNQLEKDFSWVMNLICEQFTAAEKQKHQPHDNRKQRKSTKPEPVYIELPVKKVESTVRHEKIKKGKHQRKEKAPPCASR